MQEGRPDTPPDGPAKYVEWHEPHHTVIERQDSPGSDVAVEVLSQENRDPNGGAVAKIRQSLGLLNRLKTTAGHLEDHAGNKVEQKLEEIESHVQEALSCHARPQHQSKTQQDDEEGWVSDHSQRSDHSSRTSPKGSKTRTTKLSEMKDNTSKSQPIGGTSRRRHRISVRRSHPSSTHHHIPPPAVHGSEDTENRGRAPPPTHQRDLSSTSSKSLSSWRPRSHLNSQSRPAPLIHDQRLQRIISLASPPSRDSSPSRSVRFADEEPHRSLLSSSSHVGESKHRDEIGDSMKVTFDPQSVRRDG